MIVSGEADPFHLSAGSPSTGSNSVSGEGAIAPVPDLPVLALERGVPTHKGHSAARNAVLLTVIFTMLGFG
jgi:hypothetical protein